jgi:hypothetical protein
MSRRTLGAIELDTTTGRIVAVLPDGTEVGIQTQGPTIPNSDTGSLDDVATVVDGVAASAIVFGAGSTVTVTGLAGGWDGRVLRLWNGDDDAHLILSYSDTDSVAENRIIIPGGSPYETTYRGTVTLYYDGGASRWRVIDWEAAA